MSLLSQLRIRAAIAGCSQLAVATADRAGARSAVAAARMRQRWAHMQLASRRPSLGVVPARRSICSSRLALRCTAAWPSQPPPGHHAPQPHSTRPVGTVGNSSAGSPPSGLGVAARRLLLSAAGAVLLFAAAAWPRPSLAWHFPSPPAPAASVPAPEKVASPHEDMTPLPNASELSPDELATVKLFKENTPSVVNIANIAMARAHPFLNTDVMRIPQGQGSGFVWDTSGHIVTNAHVIRGAAEVQVALIDQSVFPAKIIGGDVSKDIAVLQLDAPPEVLAQLKPVSLGSSSSLAVGQRVYAIGNPFGLDHSLSQGIISGLNRELSSSYGAGPSLRNVIQTDAAINPGNSGGVLLDSKGRLIGINTAIADPTGKGTSSGVGFAIPIDTVKGLVDQILRYGRVVRPVLGVNLAPPQALRQLGLQGVLVLDVPPGTPADKAGIEGLRRDGYGRLLLGDVIVGFNGKPVRTEADLFNALDDCKVGDTVKLDLVRGGRTRQTVTVVLGERQPEPSE